MKRLAWQNTTKQHINEKWIKVTMKMLISDLIILFIHKIIMNVSYQTFVGQETKYRFHQRVKHSSYKYGQTSQSTRLTLNQDKLDQWEAIQ